MTKLLIFFMLFLCIISRVDYNYQDIYQDKISDIVNIEVKGHLVNPGVFTLDKGDNFNDLLLLLKLHDDSVYDQININQNLVNKQVVVIGKVDEEKISINKASLNLLITLPGIKEKTAQKIIDYRNDTPFLKLEDIMNVSGIGIAKYNKIKELIKL